MKESRFTAVQQFTEIIGVVDEKFSSLTEEQKAEILKNCIKISASD